MRYSIFDPTGNVTALVESPVPVSDQPGLAAALMRRHPEVEQVGFVRLAAQPELRMAGGEFCGNASMCAAALRAMRLGGEEEQTLSLRVSGAAEPVAVSLTRTDERAFSAAVRMPGRPTVTPETLSFLGERGTLPVVRMEGITHVILRPEAAFFALRADPGAAERAVREWCAALDAACLGLMFLEGEAPELRLTPLVYVPGSGTVFWERSCASGTAAVGVALSQSGAAALKLSEPGGQLRVTCGGSGVTLFGTVRLVEEYDVSG